MPRSIVAALALACATFTPMLFAQSGELIPRKTIFGNPTRTSATISPDGRQLAFLAPRDGVLNVWVAPTGEIDKAKPITSEKVRPIFRFFWSPDSSRILYLQDKGGNENWALLGVEIASGKETAYTNFDKAQVRVLSVSPKHPEAILISVNDRNPQLHDAYRLELATGKMTLVRENTEGYAGFAPDWDLNLVFGIRQLPGGSFAIDRFDSAGKATQFATVPLDDNFTTSIVGTTADGKTLYMNDSRGRDTAALMSIDLAGSGTPALVAENPKADVVGTLRDPLTGVVEAYAANYLKNEWTPIGDTLKDDIAFLNREARGEWNVISRTHDKRLWTLSIDRVSEPVAFYLYDRPARKLTKLFTARPELEGKALASMHPVEIKTRDGLTLVSYLSLPPGTDKNNDGRPDAGPLPMVLNVHGGPWFRDAFGYHPESQWLANRGYATLQVNYRGSTGFGKKFTNAGNREFAAKMHDDLIDAVRWAVDAGVTTKDRVAIYGGSYGGFATLTGLTFTPDVFACGVDIVGPSNLVTLIESFPAYWQPFMEGSWYKRVGDPRTDEGKKFLLSRSPITKVDQIKKPLLIAQGANDPRVVQKESDQLVAEMKSRKIPVTYVLYPDEGHGFARPENRTSFYAISEGFLSKCLGGRFEPVGNDFKGASVKVIEGADFVPGLAEAAGKS
ncbi:MAG TPA: S9 family peptidase [Casimicrobiaceae bacterium]|nr:S9 family peptidase [Casimicrobiaceae bacterium]